MQDEHWVANHFVPVISVTRPKVVKVVSKQVQMSEPLQQSTVETTPTLSNYINPTVNSFYKIQWSGKIFVAQVLELSADSDGYAGIRFMEEKDNLYCWPEKDDLSWEHASDFLQEVVLHLDEGSSYQRKQWFSYSAIIN